MDATDMCEQLHEDARTHSGG
nr:hypothetical protein [Klebsiella pneumoniae]